MARVGETAEKAKEKKQQMVVASRGKEGRNPTLNVVEIPLSGGEYDELVQTYDLVLPMFNSTILEEVNTPELASMLSSLAAGIESGAYPPHETVEKWLAQFPAQYLQTVDTGGLVEEGEIEAESGEEDLLGREQDGSEGISEKSYSIGFMDGLNYGVELARDNMLFALDMVERARGKNGELGDKNINSSGDNRAAIAKMLRKIKK